MNRDPWPWLAKVPRQHGVYQGLAPDAFSARYAAVRGEEGRLLRDEDVLLLPRGGTGQLAEEWKVRADSARRLVDTLRRWKGGARILEVGCGNGWLSALLHRAGHQVLGIDACVPEVEQAARIFNGPVFALADPWWARLPAGGFDVVVFAESIQYFADVQAILDRAQELLAEGGEVHVLDSILYPDASAAQAALERSKAYYAATGHPEMATHYHAHRLPDLLIRPGTRVLQDPDRLPRLRRMAGLPVSPFTHVVIDKG